MDIGVGLDARLGLSFDEQETLSREAAEQGYTSIWTPDGAGNDGFQLCAIRWRASRDVVPEGLATGISVSPVAFRSPVSFASSAGTLSAMTGGRFSLGLGTGGIYQPATRRNLGFHTKSALAVMRDYVATTRALLAGETVDYKGEAITLKGLRLGFDPSLRTPILLGALGPKMLHLAGELSDGAAMNWCNLERVAWTREQVNEGARSAGRDPSELKLVEYIRVCIDEDIDVARRGLAQATMGYALGAKVPTERSRQFAYRGHFERMGFADELLELDEMRNRGASQDELLDAFPDEILNTVGVFATPGTARDAFLALAEGLDSAIVRVVTSRPGIDAARAVMESCAPALR
ncbi:MAG: Flavin-dependent oxidoreductase, luciferase family [Chloroflexi bacterium]|jgi:alkanesulfonate monooxygenase SsuD/methylene tetrahydromethanopterin reductase-like flavin-dependent oxidoreductase (luciferase family)|nr:MAG: Flavin-dependent oxidoreductase, luciferase family [Chloroflexota bacterium]